MVQMHEFASDDTVRLILEIGEEVARLEQERKDRLAAERKEKLREIRERVERLRAEGKLGSGRKEGR